MLLIILAWPLLGDCLSPFYDEFAIFRRTEFSWRRIYVENAGVPISGTSVSWPLNDTLPGKLQVACCYHDTLSQANQNEFLSDARQDN